jgi:hypothetical protein
MNGQSIAKERKDLQYIIRIMLGGMQLKTHIT